jgi:hypothetical protein
MSGTQIHQLHALLLLLPAFKGASSDSYLSPPSSQRNPFLLLLYIKKIKTT